MSSHFTCATRSGPTGEWEDSMVVGIPILLRNLSRSGLANLHLSKAQGNVGDSSFLPWSPRVLAHPKGKEWCQSKEPYIQSRAELLTQGIPNRDVSWITTPPPGTESGKCSGEVSGVLYYAAIWRRHLGERTEIVCSAFLKLCASWIWGCFWQKIAQWNYSNKEICISVITLLMKVVAGLKVRLYLPLLLLQLLFLPSL